MNTPDKHSDLYPGLDEALDTALERHRPQPPVAPIPPRVRTTGEVSPVGGEVIFLENEIKKSIERFPKLQELGRVALSGIIDLETLPKNEPTIKRTDTLTSLEKIKNVF